MHKVYVHDLPVLRLKRKDMTKQNNKYDNNRDCCCQRLIIEQNNLTHHIG